MPPEGGRPNALTSFFAGGTITSSVKELLEKQELEYDEIEEIFKEYGKGPDTKEKASK